VTITEANAVNAVLRAAFQPPVAGSTIDVMRVREAAELLAEHAHRALFAGFTSDQAAQLVDRWWADRQKRGS
jgi:hypothetical protein